MLEVNDAKRISWQELFDHPLLKPKLNSHDDIAGKKHNFIKILRRICIKLITVNFSQSE